MPGMRKSTKTCDRSALQSLELGVLVVLLTGCVHYFIMASSHFDFLIPDAEFFVVIGAILLIIALSLLDFKEAVYAARHMNTPHARYARPLSMTGIVLGIAILPPAFIILAILIGTQLLRFVQIKSLLIF